MTMVRQAENRFDMVPLLWGLSVDKICTLILPFFFMGSMNVIGMCSTQPLIV